MFSNKIPTIFATGLLCAYMAFPLSFLIEEIDSFSGFQLFVAVFIALILNKKVPTVLAEKKGVPYQGLVNLYIRDCAETQRKSNIKWA